MRNVFSVCRALSEDGLPAVAAIATVAAVTPAPATPTVTTAAAAASTATTLGLWARFVDDEVPAAKILAVEGVNGTASVIVVGNFDESEAARLSRETIANEIDTRGSNTDLSEPLLELLFRRGKRKVTHVKLLHLPTPSARNPSESRGAR